MKKYLLTLAVVSCLVFVGTGCAEQNQKEADRDMVNLENNNKTVVSKNAQGVPSELLKDIPLYPGSEVLGQSASPQITLNNTADCKDGEKQNTQGITMLVYDKEINSEIKKFYSSALSKAGWKIDQDSEVEMDMGVSKQVGFSATKDDLELSLISAEDRGDSSKSAQTVIMIYVQQCVK